MKLRGLNYFDAPFAKTRNFLKLKIINDFPLWKCFKTFAEIHQVISTFLFTKKIKRMTNKAFVIRLSFQPIRENLRKHFDTGSTGLVGSENFSSCSFLFQFRENIIQFKGGEVFCWILQNFVYKTHFQSAHKTRMAETRIVSSALVTL